MTPLTVFALLFALCAVGRVLAARRLVADGAAHTLNAVALYVCLPASIVLNAPDLVLDRSVAALIALPWVLLTLVAILVMLLAKLLRFDRAIVACLLLLVALGNTSFLGYSLVPALAGAGALKYAVVYDQFGSFLMLSTFGLMTIATLGGTRRPSAGSMALRVLAFPPFVTLVLALTVVPARLPAALEAALALVASTLLPLVSLALGMQLKLALPRAQRAPLAVAVVLKLVVLPATALAYCMLLGITGDMRAAAVLESAMPSMITAGALLAMAGIAPELAAAIVGYGTLLSAATLPLWRLFL
jgi:predicted permease